MLRIVLSFCGLIFLNAAVPALAGVCKFDAKKLAFEGTPQEQAKCLLRPVQKSGVLGKNLESLPYPISVAGTKVDIDKVKIQQYLNSLGIGEASVGGKLGDPLSSTAGGNALQARYFVIHDTSWNVCEDVAKLKVADEPDRIWNRESRWINNDEAHLFITRDGKFVSPQGRTFSTPWRATRLESQVGTQTRGLFLHVENVQLRYAELKRKEAAYNSKKECVNDRLAINPGFSDIQLSRLALAYVTASARGGEWLIPASHAAVDDGIKGGHDDPQNFDLGAWVSKICSHLEKLQAPCAK